MPPVYIFGDSFTTTAIPLTTPQTPASCELCDQNFHFDGNDMVVENEAHPLAVWQTANQLGEASEEGVLEEVPEIRRVERLKLAIVQLRNFNIPTTKETAQVSVSVRLDNDSEEIFTSSAVSASGSSPK